MIKNGILQSLHPRTCDKFKWFPVELCWHALYRDTVSIQCSLNEENPWFQAYVTYLLNDLFIYPTLTKIPREIALPGRDNDKKWKCYLIWLDNPVVTFYNLLWLKIWQNGIPVAYFYLWYDKKPEYVSIKIITPNNVWLTVNYLGPYNCITLACTFSW